MQIEIKHFVRFVTILAVAMGVVFFIIGMSRGLNWFEVFITGFVTIIAANVPQGKKLFLFVHFVCVFFAIY